MSRPIKWGLLALSAAILASLTFVLAHHQQSAPAKQEGSARVPSYWYDPMRPEQHFDKPGKSPFMDMQLLPKYAEAVPTGGGAAGSVAIDPRVIQTLGVRLATVERGDFERTVDTVGMVAVDEHRIEAIQVRQSGWIERLDVRAAGDQVRRGQLLAAIYSPDLLATQQEFLIARRSGDADLSDAVRQRLSLFGLSDAQIARIEQTGHVERAVKYYAPFDGYVMALGARQGAAVEPGTSIFQLASLQKVWLIAEVPEAQAAWIAPGNPAQAEVAALPG